MIHLSYTMTKEDMLDYYEHVLSKTSETKTEKLIALIWGPVLCGAIILALRLFGIYQTYFLVIGIILSLLWILIAYPYMFRKLCRKAAERKMLNNETNYQEIDIQEENGLFYINGMKKDLENYYGLGNQLIITFTDTTKLIIPERAFQNETLMKQFIKDIMMKKENII
ncbi:MAG: hypothetical protein ACI4U3_09545 [Traorella sp.]